MINRNRLEELIEQGYIERHKHPTADLFIYNYTPLAQFERKWEYSTLACRGLILDAQYQVIARPFLKFFNLEEHQTSEIPNSTFEVYEKLDGSLGILYPLDNQYFIATRGSFDSKQSRKANELLHQKYAHILPQIQQNKTYLFEIIYPENRVVVDYGEKEELILIGVIDNQTGKEEKLPDIGFPLVRLYDGIRDIHTLKQLDYQNHEGFVVKFASGFRVKVKFEEYIRLHRILTQVSSKTIWEYLSNNESLEKILEKVPDEFYHWVRSTIHKLTTDFQEIEDYCKQHFKILETKKDTALYFKTLKYESVLFAMLNGKNYAPIIWKMIEPSFEKPFAEQG
jgi:RNA ligase